MTTAPRDPEASDVTTADLVPVSRKEQGALRARRLRNAPVLLSVVTKFGGRGRAAWVSAGLRAAPAQMRADMVQRLQSQPVRGLVATADSLAALGVAAQGRTVEALDTLTELGAGARGRKLAGVVDALVVLHRPDLARQVLADAQARRDSRGTRRRSRLIPVEVEARLLMEEGNFDQARSLLPDRGHRRLRSQLADEVSALDASSRTEVTQPAAVRPAATSRGWRTPIHTHRPVAVAVTHLVTTSLPEAQTGYTIRTQGIARAQVLDGIDVEVITRLGFPVDTGHPDAEHEVDVEGVTYRRLIPLQPLPAAAGKRLDMAIAMVRRRVRQTSPAVLHAHSKHDNAQIALAVGRSLDVAVVYEVRGFLEETWVSRGGDPDSERYRLTRQAETTTMARADAVVTLSQTMKDHICARGIDPDRVHAVPNAVPDNYLLPLPSAAQARRNLDIDALSRVVGVAGTLNEYEGLDTVIRALSSLDDPRVVFLVVGDGPARDSLEALAAELGVDVRFTGRVGHAEVRHHIAAMDLFCVPRRRTPVTAVVPPLKPLEALATGTPVLASDLPPLAELMASAPPDQPFGWLAPPDEPLAWAKELRRLLYDHQSLARAGSAGRRWATRERTWPRLMRRYQQVYRAAESIRARREHD